MNQLEEETSVGKTGLLLNTNRVSSEVTMPLNPLKSLLGNGQTSIAKSFGNWRQELLDFKLESSQIKPKPADVIWYFYNRFFPIKLVINQLAKIMVTQQNNWIEVGDLQVQSFEFAQEVATKLKNIEVFTKLQEKTQQFVIDNLKNNDPNPYKVGINYFPKNLRNSLLSMLDELKENGIFIIPNGSVEKWLPTYGIQGEKNKWIVEILNKIVDVTVIPDDDVWKFMQEIRLCIEKQYTMI